MSGKILRGPEAVLLNAEHEAGKMAGAVRAMLRLLRTVFERGERSDVDAIKVLDERLDTLHESLWKRFNMLVIYRRPRAELGRVRELLDLAFHLERAGDFVSRLLAKSVSGSVQLRLRGCGEARAKLEDVLTLLESHSNLCTTAYFDPAQATRPARVLRTLERRIGAALATFAVAVEAAGSGRSRWPLTSLLWAEALEPIHAIVFRAPSLPDYKGRT